MDTLTHHPITRLLRAAGFVGRFVAATDSGYDDARSCFNRDVDRRPAGVAYASDADDVAAVIRACHQAQLPFTVRAGGHSISGRSMRDGAVCIDLRALDTVDVDPATGVVRVGGGALLGELDAASQKHGLAVPAGQVSHTGVGGLTLGGGVGWLMRKHGLTIDSLRELDVVLADGSQVHASADEHAELFWALRGGGGDFAAVTAFTFQARQVGPMVLGGVMVYGWEHAAAAFREIRDLMLDAPDELSVFVVLVTAPPVDPFPPPLHGQRLLLFGVSWCGDLDDGARTLDRVRMSCPPLADLTGPMPYVALQSMIDTTTPHGWSYYDKQHYLADVSDAFIDALLGEFERVPEPEAHVLTGWLGGAVARVPPGETAFGHRDAQALTWIIGSSGLRPLDAAREWVRDTWRTLERYSTGGAYVNALDADRPVRDAYATDIWERLVGIKQAYDPTGAFSGNGIG